MHVSPVLHTYYFAHLSKPHAAICHSAGAANQVPEAGKLPLSSHTTEVNKFGCVHSALCGDLGKEKKRKEVLQQWEKQCERRKKLLTLEIAQV